MHSNLHKWILLAAAFWFSAACVRAQDPAAAGQSATPQGEVGAPSSSSALSQEKPGAADTLPLSGAQDITVGAIQSRHSFILPSLNVTEQVDSNPFSLPAATFNTFETRTLFMGRIGLLQQSAHSEFIVDYQGGGSDSSYQASRTSMLHSLQISERFFGHRWSLLLGGQGSYLPESSFGLSNAGGLDAYGVGGSSRFGGLIDGAVPNFRPGLLPSQSISTANVYRISGIGVLQATFKVSRRTSLTAFGSYGMLHFLDSAFYDSRQILAQAGYEVQASRNNTVAFSYRYAEYLFRAQDQTIRSHAAFLSYARRITGRLGWQISGGPQYLEFSPVIPAVQRLYWSANSSLNYQLSRLTLGADYDHGVSGGSGLLLGSEADQLQGTLSRSLSRNLQGVLALGYSDNHALSQTEAAGIKGNLRFWFGSARIERRFASRSSIFLAYNARLQNLNLPNCLGSECAPSAWDHQISVGLNLTARPLILH
ncbi:MAG: hypothetical protein LAN71_00570 [Acidobacteriia bacterium]|nr:hypothetical protein [Terriglobia bacterium]